MTHLPIDVWLIICDFVDDYNTLWSVLRNVSQHIRACVDEHFRHDVLRKCVINLTYSTIHSTVGPNFYFLHLPMQFNRFSEDGVHAVFRQVRHKGYLPSGVHKIKGSVRGWVPFIERYCTEMNQSSPNVLNKSKSAAGAVLWEVKYPNASRSGPMQATRPTKTRYTRLLRDLTSIGRGDRPPYCITLGDYAHDTELTDLSINCTAREISIDWRRTLSAFFMERHFIVLAKESTEKKRLYGKDLDRAAETVQAITRVFTYDRHVDDWRHARRKRLQTWVKKNHRRMSREHRLMTEDSVLKIVSFINDANKAQRHDFDQLRDSGVDLGEVVPDNRVDNFVELRDSDVDIQEIVPEKCAEDHPGMMLWPANRAERKQAEQEVKIQRCTCIMM